VESLATLKQDFNRLYASEQLKYTSLALKEMPLTTSGSVTWISTSSGATYNSTSGELGLTTLLQNVLKNYIVGASEFNGKLDILNLLSEIKKIDGAGSGIDADTLGGYAASYFMTSASVSATTSNITYYVSKTGNNSNNGLTSGTAFLTIQKAIDNLPTIINHDIIINVANGDYSEVVTIKKIGNGSISITAATVSDIDDINCYFKNKLIINTSSVELKFNYMAFNPHATGIGISITGTRATFNRCYFEGGDLDLSGDTNIILKADKSNVTINNNSYIVRNDPSSYHSDIGAIYALSSHLSLSRTTFESNTYAVVSDYSVVFSSNCSYDDNDVNRLARNGGQFFVS